MTKLNSSGSALVYSTYLGGAGDDAGSAIAVDSSGNAYITGSTSSAPFPTVSPLQGSNAGGNSDAFIAKLNATGTALLYSTYLGGTGADSGNSIAIDGNRNAYVTGSTTSTDFPLVNGLYATGGVFVTMVNASGSAFTYSTHLAGNACALPCVADSGNSIAATSTGTAYITGVTTSDAFPKTGNALQSTYTPGDIGNAFLTVLGSSLSPTADSISPNSGSGTSQTFAARYSNPSGAAGFTGAYMLINSGFDALNSCYVQYLPAGNGLYLLNDAANAWLGPITPGTGTLQNNQCTLNGTGSTVTSVGNVLTVNAALTFKPAFAGNKTVYLFAYTVSATTGFLTAGTWTVTAGTPTAGPLSPASGSGASQTFSAPFTNPGGAAAFTSAYMLINSGFNAVNSCYVQYLPSGNGLYLLNDAANAWLGPIAPGSGAIVQNNQCTLNGTGSSITSVGNVLTVNAAITFKPAFAGSKTVYLFANTASATTGFQTAGTWTVTAGAPTAGPLSPASGSGASQTFSAPFTNPGGAAAFTSAYMLINSGFNAVNSCYIQYLPSGNGLYLLNDAASAWLGPITPGSGATLQNNQCTLNGAGSSVTSVGNVLTVNSALTFKPAFSGGKTVYLFANTASATTGFQTAGTWTVTAGAPTAGPLSPASGSGASQSFSAPFTNPGGAGAFTSAYMLINSGFNAVNSCYIQYLPSGNGLYLLNDAANAWLGPITPGSGATLQNNQCTLNGAGSSVTSVGNVLTVNSALTFKPAFSGSKTVYLFGYTASSSTGFQTSGTWNVP